MRKAGVMDGTAGAKLSVRKAKREAKEAKRARKKRKKGKKVPPLSR